MALQGRSARDAFSLLRWKDRSFAFPPVPLLTLTLEKIERDGCRVILVAPLWRSATWWDTAQAMMVGEPWVLGLSSTILQPKEGSRLPRLGVLMACLLEGGSNSSRSS